VDHVAARLGERAFRRELVHRDEHSIEFQVLYLQHRLRGRSFTIVPILAGAFHRLLDERKSPRDESSIEVLIAAVREAEQVLGGATTYVAGVDFSHMGPRFGDARITEEAAELLRKSDEDAIAAAASGDADAWFRAIASTDDVSRICGFAPTYCMLRCAAPAPGRALMYEPSPEPDGSVVTVAAMVWPPAPSGN
jgi:AmmeMemoRadiSam system protein B